MTFESSRRSKDKLGFNATWSMAVGGMVGGGIFSTLGVVISIAGGWAWLSFLVAGAVAFCTAYAYAKLAEDAEEAGGAFTFLRHIDMPNLAGGLAWVLLVGYVLTNAVYAFTFGEYVGNVVDSGPWLARFAGIAIVAVFVVVNLVGVGESSAVEIFLVWFKLVVLVSLAVWGIAEWRPELLSRGVPKADPLTAVFGAASVFMAYEGFQLLTYDYDDIEKPKQTLRRATLWAVGVVVVVYVGVAVGVPMIVGADTIVENKVSGTRRLRRFTDSGKSNDGSVELIWILGIEHQLPHQFEMTLGRFPGLGDAQVGQVHLDSSSIAVRLRPGDPAMRLETGSGVCETTRGIGHLPGQIPHPLDSIPRSVEGAEDPIIVMADPRIVSELTIEGIEEGLDAGHQHQPAPQL